MEMQAQENEEATYEYTFTVRDRRGLEGSFDELPERYTLRVPVSEAIENLENLRGAAKSFSEEFQFPLETLLVSAPLYFRVLMAWATMQSDRTIEEVFSAEPEFFCVDQVKIYCGTLDKQKSAALNWDSGVRAAVAQYVYDDSNPMKDLMDMLKSLAGDLGKL